MQANKGGQKARVEEGEGVLLLSKSATRKLPKLPKKTGFVRLGVFRARPLKCRIIESIALDLRSIFDLRKRSRYKTAWSMMIRVFLRVKELSDEVRLFMGCSRKVFAVDIGAVTILFAGSDLDAFLISEIAIGVAQCLIFIPK